MLNSNDMNMMKKYGGYPRESSLSDSSSDMHTNNVYTTNDAIVSMKTFQGSSSRLMAGNILQEETLKVNDAKKKIQKANEETPKQDYVELSEPVKPRSRRDIGQSPAISSRDSRQESSMLINQPQSQADQIKIQD